MSLVTLITGASSGFGNILARRLAAAGHVVYATMRDPDGRNASPAAALSAIDGISVLELDVISDSSVEDAISAALSESGRIDVVVNNAGFAGFGITESYTIDQWQAMFDVNLFGCVRVNRAVLPSMRQRGNGLLVHVTSIAGRLPAVYMGAYASSKWALEGYAEILRLELAPCGVDCVVVEPGKYRTEIFDKTLNGADVQRAEAYGAADYSAAFMKRFVELMDGDAQDPAEVARIIHALIEMPAGQRPFRTLAGGDAQPLAPYNAAADELRAVVGTIFDLPQLLTLQRREAAAG